MIRQVFKRPFHQVQHLKSNATICRSSIAAITVISNPNYSIRNIYSNKTLNSNSIKNTNLSWNHRSNHIIKRYFADNPNKPSNAEKETETTTTMEVEPTALESEASSEAPVDLRTEEEEVEFIPEPPKPTYQTQTPMELIAEVPPIEVDAPMVICNGLYFNSDMTKRTKWWHAQEGHPAEYIQLNTRKPYSVQTCKYCGLRFVMERKKSHPFAKYYKGPDVTIKYGDDKPTPSNQDF